MANQRPGVFVEEIASPNVAATVEGVSTAALHGTVNRGPLGTPVLTTSWAEFKRTFGGFDTDLTFAAWLFYHNGGSRLWVNRVTGVSAVVATRTLADRDGTPVDTLKVDAANEGTWGNTVYLEVEDSGTSGYFDLIVREGATAAVSTVVERWDNVTMDDDDARFVETIVNHPTLGSTYITVTDLDSGTAAPGDTPALTAGTPVALTGGVNATVTDTDIGDDLSDLDLITEPFALNLGGCVDTTAVTAALTYAAARGDVFVVCDPTAGETPAEAVTAAQALTASSYGAYYYPSLYFSDPSSNEPGAVRLLPPGGAVLGKYAQTDDTRGVHKDPAGRTVRVNGASSVETRLTNANLDTLNTAAVNVIRPAPGAGIVIMGARTLDPSLASRYISTRRSLNYLKYALATLTEFAVFEPNDESLWGTIEARCGRFLREFWQSGGLRGATAEQAFYVQCDAELNTPAVIASGQTIIEVGVATQRPSEFIIIRLGQWQGGQNAEEA